MEAAWIPESQHGGHLSGKFPQMLSSLCVSEKYTLVVLNH